MYLRVRIDLHKVQYICSTHMYLCTPSQKMRTLNFESLRVFEPTELLKMPRIERRPRSVRRKCRRLPPCRYIAPFSIKSSWCGQFTNLSSCAPSATLPHMLHANLLSCTIGANLFLHCSPPRGNRKATLIASRDIHIDSIIPQDNE